MSVLRNDFDVGVLRSTVEPLGITGTVLVQAQQTVAEAEWLLECADQEPLIRGVVGWVPLAENDDTLIPVLEKLSANSRFKGVRHVVQDEPDEKFLLRNNFSRGIARLRSFGLVYDLLVYSKQLPMAAALVDRHPEQVFVLDHIAKPRIVGDRFDADWAANLKELARRENVACKFSGLVTEVRDPHWSVETLRPYWETVVDAFGIERMMFGSDWPVCLLRSRYDQWLSTVNALTSELSDSQNKMFWSDNAIQYYNLDVAVSV